MQRALCLLLIFALAACQGNGTLTVLDPNATNGSSGTLLGPGTGGPDTITGPTVTTTGGGACGDVTEHDVRILGKVLAPDGDGAVAAVVYLEDRAWNMTELGSTVTDGNGEFDFVAMGVTAVQNCWGLLDYVIVAEHQLGIGEDGINPPLRGAIDEGTLEADLTNSPIRLE